MRITVTLDGDQRQMMATLGAQILDGSNRATERQTKETLQSMRTEITRGLSARAANAFRNRWIFNQLQGGGNQVVGFLYSGWRKRPRSGGQDVDMFQAFEDGAIIRPVRGKYLAIALPAAYAVVGAKGGRGEKPTPYSVEKALGSGAKLFPIQRPGHPPILAARDVAIGTGRRARIRGARGVSKKGAVIRRRTSSAIVPMFVLLRNVRLPKRVDFSRIEDEGAAGLENKLITELAGRGVFD